MISSLSQQSRQGVARALVTAIAGDGEQDFAESLLAEMTVEEKLVQLNLRDEVATVTRPVKELRGFRKVHLQPSERTIVSFTLTPADLVLYDQSMKRVVEPGFFTVFVGTSSAEVLDARFQVTAL